MLRKVANFVTGVFGLVQRHQACRQKDAAPLLSRVVDFVRAQPSHEQAAVEAELRNAPDAAVRFSFLTEGQPQHALYVALRDDTPLPPKAKEQLQNERRQRAKLLAAKLAAEASEQKSGA